MESGETAYMKSPDERNVAPGMNELHNGKNPEIVSGIEAEMIILVDRSLHLGTEEHEREDDKVELCGLYDCLHRSGSFVIVLSLI
jgi:hypothetical protein